MKRFFLKNAKFVLSTGEYVTNCLKKYGVKEDNIRYYPFTSIMKSDIAVNKLSDIEKALYKSTLGIKASIFF